MNTILKKHFPMLKDRQTIIDEIKSSPDLLNTYDGWSKDEQEKFLDYCTGERGLKITYDSYFKEIFNYNYNPERLNNLLSCIIGQKVEILEVLPNEGARIASEKTLLITDMLVRMEDQSLVNIEIQKIGYLFPGERASCYSSDLLLREYKRVRDERKRHFKYGDIKPVYTIVIFEDSPSNLKEAKDFYIHKSNTVFDTGVKINLLQKFIFISLDNFNDILHNRVEVIKQNSISLATNTNDKSNNESIKLFESKLEEWLTFLSIDEPEYIAMLINHNPYFKAIYTDIYEMCLNTERLMQMYSKELAELDHNTVIYMIDEIKAEVDKAKEEANRFKEDADRFKDEADRFKDEADRFKDEADRFKDEANRSKEEANRFKKDASLAKEEANRFKKDASLAKEEANRFKEDASLAKEETNRFKEEASLAKEETNRFKEEASLAKEEASLAKEENDRLKAEIEELKTQLGKVKSVD